MAEIYEKKDETVGGNIYSDALSFMDSWYSGYSSLLLPYKRKINAWDKLYRCIPEKKNYGLANVFVPETYIAIETLTADIMDILFSRDPFFDSEPVPPEMQNHVRAMRDLMWTLMQNGGFRREAMKYIRKILKEGSVPAYIYYAKEYNRRARDKAIDTAGTVTLQPKQRLVKNYPAFDTPDYAYTYADPFCDIEEAKGVMFEWHVPLRKLKELAGANRIIQERLGMVTKNKARTDKTPGSEKAIETERQQNAGFSDISSGQAETKYRLRVFFGWFSEKWVRPEMTDSDEEILGEIIQVDDTICGINENDYLGYEIPVVNGKMVEIDNEFYSMSAAGILESTQKELNDTRNQEIDFKTFSLYCIWLKSKQANLRNEDMKIKPWGIWEVNGIPSQMLQPLRPDPTAFKAGSVTEETMKADIQRASGATAPRQGLSGGSRTTAVEIQTMQVRGGMRAYLIAMTIAETWLKPMLRMYWDLIKQNVGEPVKVIGKEARFLEPKEIYGDYVWIPKILTDPLNMATIENSMLQVMDSLGRIPQFAAGSILKLARKWYEQKGFRDAEDIFPSDPLAAQISPEDEDKVMAQAKLVNAMPFHSHTQHLDKHIAAFQKEQNPSAKLVMNEHIKQHFEFTNIMQQMTAQMPPELPGAPGAPMPQGGTQNV